MVTLALRAGPGIDDDIAICVQLDLRHLVGASPRRYDITCNANTARISCSRILSAEFFPQPIIVEMRGELVQRARDINILIDNFFAVPARKSGIPGKIGRTDRVRTPKLEGIPL